MPKEDAVTRLLYAILSQKCLKDIDWNKVAHHPLLEEEISNGHAARMRYSRFKKQIEGIPTIRRPRNPNSPRKNKVEKSKSPTKKVKESNNSDDDEDVKQEIGENEGRAGLVKNESGVGSSTDGTPLPHTPITSTRLFGEFQEVRESESPASFGGAGEMSQMDEMYTSFGMPGVGEGLYGPGEPFPHAETFGMGLGMQMGMGDPYEGLWGGAGDADGHQEQRNGSYIKTEERW